RAVCSGAIEPAPEGAAAAPWLHAVLIRGLARRPADRYADMDALLAALVSDPSELRRGRLRALARFVAAMIASGLLIYAASVAWTQWSRRQRERAAGERLERMERRIAALAEEGDPLGADRVFDAFVRSPDNQGTAALPLAWLRRAKRAEDAGEHDSALAAYAASFAVATAPEHELEALTALLRSFRADLRWHRLIEAVAVLEGRAPEAFADAELRDAQLLAATSRRDLEGAAAVIERLPESSRRKRLARLIAAMTPAHRTENAGGGWVLGSNGDATEFAYRTYADAEAVARLDASLELPVVGTRTGYKHWRGVPTGPGEPARYSAYDDAAGEVVLLQAAGAELVELTRFKDYPALSSASGDLDGDGVREHFLGTGPYSRHLVELTAAADGSWSRRNPAPSLDARISDVTSLFAADLDGDGVGELVAGLGPWMAHEVHVLRRERASDDFTSLARARLGDVYVAPFRGRRGLEIAALSTDTTGLPGEALGLHLLRLEGETLVRTGYAALPGPSGGFHNHLLVGDLDGDGVDEAVALQTLANDEAPFPRALLVFSVGEEGEIDVLPLTGLEPLAFRDLDGDGDDELVVYDSEHVWVLGAGSQRLPVVVEELGAVDPPPDAAGERRENWEHARELAQIGLYGHAADAFVALADSVAATDEGVAARAALAAGRLRLRLRDDGPAAALFARAAADPALTEEAGAAAIDAFLSRGDVDEVRALLDALAAESAGELVARERAKLEALVDARIDVRFEHPLESAWRIDAPLALSRDPLAGTLDVEATGETSIAALPIAAEGGDLILEVDVDLRRIEWGGRLSISLVSPARDFRALGVEILAGGGTTSQSYRLLCASGSHLLGIEHAIDLERPRPLGRRRLRAVLRPARGELTCTVVDADGNEVDYKRESITVGGAQSIDRGELWIATHTSTDASPLVSAGLRSVSVIGAKTRERGERDALSQPLIAARRALVEGDHVGALAALDADAAARVSVDVPAVDRALWRLHVLMSLGRWGEAEALARAWLEDPTRRDEAERGLGLLLRREPSAMQALLREIEGPTALRSRLVNAYKVAFLLRRRDPTLIEQLRRALEDYRPEPGEDPGESALLLMLRAELYAARGQPARSRRDYAAARAFVDISLATGAARMQRERAQLLVDEATQAARAGDDAAARELVAEALRDELRRALVEDMIVARPELAALQDDRR
ncbi:MAG: hypothetical protein KC486_23130, partial [Myxococcales bacterium]|nr:hypothetical protein [Myxococcales bacterium]